MSMISMVATLYTHLNISIVDDVDLRPPFVACPQKYFGRKIVLCGLGPER